MPTLAAQLHSADKTVRILLLIRIGVKNREIKTPIRVSARAAIKHTEPSRTWQYMAAGPRTHERQKQPVDKCCLQRSDDPKLPHLKCLQ